MSKDNEKSATPSTDERSFCCTQCGLEFPNFTEEELKDQRYPVIGALVLNHSRWLRSLGTELGAVPIPFCTAKCLVSFLRNPDNHARIYWFEKTVLEERAGWYVGDDFFWEGGRVPGDEQVTENGPYIVASAPYGSWFDDVSGPMLVISVERLIYTLEKEDEESVNLGLEIRPWYRDIP